MSVVSVNEFKGHKILEISNGPDDKYPFRFGLKKAEMVLEHREEIEKFVKENKEN